MCSKSFWSAMWCNYWKEFQRCPHIIVAKPFKDSPWIWVRVRIIKMEHNGWSGLKSCRTQNKKRTIPCTDCALRVIADDVRQQAMAKHKKDACKQMQNSWNSMFFQMFFQKFFGGNWFYRVFFQKKFILFRWNSFLWIFLGGNCFHKILLKC